MSQRDPDSPPDDALWRLERLVVRAGGELHQGDIHARWMHALAWAETVESNLNRAQARIRVLERRLKLMLEVGAGEYNEEE